MICKKFFLMANIVVAIAHPAFAMELPHRGGIFEDEQQRLTSKITKLEARVEEQNEERTKGAGDVDGARYSEKLEITKARLNLMYNIVDWDKKPAQSVIEQKIADLKVRIEEQNQELAKGTENVDGTQYSEAHRTDYTNKLATKQALLALIKDDHSDVGMMKCALEDTKQKMEDIYSSIKKQNVQHEKIEKGFEAGPVSYSHLALLWEKLTKKQAFFILMNEFQRK